MQRVDFFLGGGGGGFNIEIYLNNTVTRSTLQLSMANYFTEDKKATFMGFFFLNKNQDWSSMHSCYCVGINLLF